MTLILIALIAVIIALLYNFLKYKNTYWERHGVPCIPGHLIYGNFHGIGKTRHFRDVNIEVYSRFKGKSPIAGLYLVFQKAYSILDLDLIKDVLIKDFSTFHDRGLYYNEEDDPLSAHLFAIGGEKWRALRTKITPVFTSGKMKFMFPTIVSVAENLTKSCRNLMETNSNGVIEMKDLCARFTTDVIGTCAFGLECNSLNDPNAEFRQKGRDIFEKPRHTGAVRSFIFTNPKWAKALHMKAISDDISEFFIRTVRKTIDYRRKNNIRRNDFIDLMMDLMAPDEIAFDKTKNSLASEGLSLFQIAAQAFVFFIAGFDTSSTTMSFCLYELALNQEIQDRLRAEILETLDKHDGVLNYECMKEMQYLDQVLFETLRKYTVVPHLNRFTAKDYPIPNTNFVMKKDTMVIIPVDAIHHDPELYPEPEKFDPSRFEPEAVKERHAAAFLPFGDGPRNCVGLRFGKMQAKIGLIYLLKSFKFTKCSQTEIPLIFSKKNFIISAENGIYLSVEALS